MTSAKQPVEWGASPRKQEGGAGKTQALDAFVGSKRGGQRLKRLNLDIPAELHTRIKVACVLAERDMTTVVTEMLEERFPEK